MIKGVWGPIIVVAAVILFSVNGIAQSTEIAYQGQLQSGGSAASGPFDFEFALFDGPGGGSQIGPTLPRNGVAVANGVFSVILDFGSSFPGADRYLEIRVRTSGGGGFTTLSPRQRVASSPYSIKSLSSNTAEAANSALTANNATNAVNAQNAANATNAVTSTNFSGPLTGDVTGTQGATTVARLRGRNMASTAPASGQVLKYNGAEWEPGTDNTGSGGGGTITGVTAGTGLTGGGTTGSVTVGIANGGVTTAQLADNSVTDAKITGVGGSKVTGTVANATNAATATNAQQLGGIPANQYVTTANGGALFIRNDTAQQPASNFNVSGIGSVGLFSINSHLSMNGSFQPAVAPAGQGRIYFDSGSNRMRVSQNNGAYVDLVGAAGGVGGSGTINTIPLWNGSTTLSDSQITQSSAGVQLPNNVQLAVGALGHQLAFGSPNGETGLSIASPNGPRADLRFNGLTLKLAARPAGSGPPSELNGIIINTDGDVAIGTTNLAFGKLSVTGFAQTAITASSNFGYGVEADGVFGGLRGFSSGQGARGVYGISQNGIGIEGSSNGSNNFAIFSNGFLGFDRLGTDGNVTLCRNAANQIATCGSSLRYKTDLNSYAGGLDVINRLQPLTYRWKSDNSMDLGFVAESVAEIEPLLTTRNDKGEIEGVKYDRLSTVFVNAIKEQQKQIESQQKAIEQQRKQISDLIVIVCGMNSKLAICSR